MKIFTTPSTPHNGHVLQRAAYYAQSLYTAIDHSPDNALPALEAMYARWDDILLRETTPYLDPADTGDDLDGQWEYVFNLVDSIGAQL